MQKTVRSKKDGRELKELKGEDEGTIGVLFIIILIQNPSIYRQPGIQEMTPVKSLRCWHLSSRLFFPPACNKIILQNIVQVVAWFSSQTFTANVLVLISWLFWHIQQKSSTLKNSCMSSEIHVSNQAQLFLINSLIEPNIEVIVLSPPLRCCSSVLPKLARIDGFLFQLPQAITAFIETSTRISFLNVLIWHL